MLHKAWNSKGEMPYCFPRSSIKFQGHTGQNITDFDPNWAFPDSRPVAAFKSLRFALFIWNWSNTIDVRLALWMLMAWCFCTRASVATVLTTHTCVSWCLGVNKHTVFEPLRYDVNNVHWSGAFWGLCGNTNNNCRGSDHLSAVRYDFNGGLPMCL